MLAELLNTIGLIFGIIGVIIVFFYAFPQPTFEGGFGLALEDATKLKDGRTVAEHKANRERERLRYRHRSRFGLGLMAVGFALQLAATWS
jgi:hypothetical protein